MVRTDVFLSVGSGLGEQQEAFVSRFEEYLRTSGLEPHTVGRTEFSASQPLKPICELIERCAGTVVIALERTYISDGVDRRGTPKEQHITDAALPTCWNQIEAAMAYTLDHPLLVLVERGLKCEGLLEGRYDWYVQEIDLDASVFSSRQFLGIFNDWRQNIVDRQAKKRSGNDDKVTKSDVSQTSLK